VFETHNIEHLVATANKGERQISTALPPKFYSSISVTSSFLPVNLIICSGFPSLHRRVFSSASSSFDLLDFYLMYSVGTG